MDMDKRDIQYAALLRGISPANPNMRNEKLRKIFANLGFKNVRTVISSGNVLFESPSKDIQAIEAKIEKAFPEQLGFTSTAITRSLDQLKSLIDKNPFKGLEDSPKSRLNVTFLKNTHDKKIKFPYQPDNKTYKLLDLYGHAVFSVIDLSGDKTPDLMSWLEKQFGKEITTRTWKTVHRIVSALE